MILMKKKNKMKKKKKLYISIFDKLFISNQYQMKYSYYYDKYKMNLYKECQLCHIHINNLYFKEIKN